jgi:hypothetical protein
MRRQATHSKWSETSRYGPGTHIVSSDWSAEVDKGTHQTDTVGDVLPQYGTDIVLASPTRVCIGPVQTAKPASFRAQENGANGLTYVSAILCRR